MNTLCKLYLRARKSFVAGMAVTAIVGIPLRAQLTVYSNYASWSAAVGLPITTATFDAASGGPFVAGYTEAGVLFRGLSAGPYNGYLYPTHGGYCAPTGCLVGPATEAGALGATDGRIRSTTPTSVFAAAMDYGTYHSGGDIPIWTFSNGYSYTGAPDSGDGTFIGFISDTPFAFVDFHISVGSSGGDFTVMDTFYYPSSTVPEPATVSLIAAGLLAIVAARLRRPVRRS